MICDELKNILARVRCLYQKYGIKSITMDDVSRELGISKKTLYQHVKDKTELVEGVVDMEIERHTEIFGKIFNNQYNAIEELFEVQKVNNQMIKDHNPSQMYDLKKYYPEQFEKVVKARRNVIYNNILNNIIKGKTEGLYRAELNNELIAKLHLLRIENAFDTDIFTLEEITSNQLFYEIFVYHIRGISTRQGIEFLEKKIKETENNQINS